MNETKATAMKMMNANSAERKEAEKMMGRGMNTKAIDKIISELSMRDYKAQIKRNGSRRIRHGQFSYSLGSDTMEAVETKRAYIAGGITEEEYKAFCLRYNLLSSRS